MTRALAVCVLAVLASAAFAAPVPEARLQVTPTHKVIDEGEDVVLSFTLSEPIICRNKFEYCSVLLLITNTRPDEISLSSCHVEWLPSEWDQTKTITVHGVEDFVSDGEKTFVLVTEPLQSKSEFYSESNPDDIEINTKSYQPAQCSSTTDPNYISFDGRRFTFNGVGTYLLWGAHMRDWEVQTRISNGRNCGVAVREGCDLVVLDQCSSSGLVIYSDFNNPASQRLTVRQKSGTNIYIIGSARSAAEVRVEVRVRILFEGTTACGWSGCRRVPRYSRTEWLDVYGTAPGFDYGYIDRGNSVNTEARTRGLCGSYDDNRGNDQTNGNGLLIPSSKNFFRTRKAGTCAPYSPPEPNVAYCPEPQRPVRKPVLRNPDIEDLTEVLRNIRITEDDPRAAYNFDAMEVSSRILGDDVIDRYENLCESALVNSLAADVCQEVGVDIQQYIDNCVQDMVTQEDEELILGAIDSMKEDCEFLASTNITLFDTDDSGNLVPGALQRQVVERLCPGDCSFNGECDNGTCICNEGWSGMDCSTNLTVVPAIRGLFPFSCDINTECPTTITVSSDQLLPGSDLSCRVDNTESSGRFLASVSMECNIPRHNLTGAQERVFSVRIARDAGRFSGALPFVFYDGRCKQCTRDGECTIRDSACVINNQCVLEGQAAPNNPCMTCQPNVSQTEYSPSFGHSECTPAIGGLDSYLTVSEGTPRGQEVAAFTVSNPFFTEQYTVALTHGTQGDADPVFDVLDRGNGEFALVLLNQLDYESTPSLEVTATAKGASSGLAASTTVAVDVLNVNEDPSMDQDGYTATVVENAAARFLFQVSASDPDSGLQRTETDRRFAQLTFSLAGFRFASDAALFTIDAGTGAVSTTEPLDYEARAEYSFGVVVRDGTGARATATATITVQNVNERPTFVRLSQVFVYETAEVGTVVGQLTTADPDRNDAFTYALLNGTGLFAIDQDKLVTASSFNFHGENKDVALRVRSTDAGGLSVEKVLRVRIVDENDAPTNVELVVPTHAAPLTEGLTSLPEDMPTGSVVGTFKVTDPDLADLHVITLLDDADGTFAVSGDVLVLVKPLDFETTASHTIRVQATDTGLPPLPSPEKTFTIAVEDRPDAPREIALDLSMDVFEDTPANTLIGEVQAMDDDPNQPMTMEVSDGCPFALGDVTCADNNAGHTVCRAPVTLTQELDLEGDEYDCVVTVTSTIDDLVGSTEITVPVLNVNEPPSSVTLDPATVSEGVTHGAFVGFLSATDPDLDDVEFEFSLPSKAGDAAAQARFAVERVASSDDGMDRPALVVVGGLDHEARPVETVTIAVTDAAGLTATFSVDVAVQDLPMELSISTTRIPEVVDASAAVGREVAHVSLLHLDRDDLDIAFAVSPANTPFKVVPAAQRGVARVLIRDGGALDYEQAVGHAVSFGVSATFTLSSSSSSATAAPVPNPVQATFRMKLEDVEEPPVFSNDETSDPVRLAPDAASGTPLVVLSAFDPEADGAVTYRIVSGNDDGIFLIGSSTGAVVVLQTPEITGATVNQRFDLVVEASDGTSSTRFVLPIVLDSTLTTSSKPSPTWSTNPSTTSAGGPTIVVDPTAPGTDLEESNSGSSSSAATVPIVAGVCAGLLLVVAVALLLYVRHRSGQQKADPLTGAGGVYASGPPGTMDNPLYHSTHAGFDDGFSAQLCPWYRADMTREDSEAELVNRGAIGDFIIRTYPMTPGWHMLHVKTGATQVSEAKIRPHGARGQFAIVGDELAGGQFDSLPELVHHYALNECPKLGVRLNVAASQGDSQHEYDDVQTLRPGAVLLEDPEAPHLPLKHHQQQMIEQVATGEDVYGNTTAARDLLSSSKI